MQTVTALIPSYNDEKWIGECLRSIIGQTHSVDEIFYLDDGSTDKSVEIVNNIAKESTIPIRVKAYEHTGNKAHKLNDMLENVKTNFIWVIEGDAKYAPDHLEKLLQSFGGPEIGGAIGRLHCWEVNGFWDKCREAEFAIRYKNYRPFTAWLLRTEIVKKLGGYDTKVWRFEDFFMGRAIRKAGYKIAFVKDALWWHNEKTNPFEIFGRRSEASEGYWIAFKSQKWLPVHIPLWTVATLGTVFFGWEYFLSFVLAFILGYFILTGIKGFGVTKNPLVWMGISVMKFLNNFSSMVSFWLGPFFRR